MKRKISKFSASAVAATLVVTASTGALAATPTFKDVPENHPYFNQIELLASKGIIKGVGNDLFNPNGKVTRAQMAKMIVNTLGLTSEKKATFSDVPETSVYYNDIAILAGLNITVGDGTGKFLPNKEASREEIALFLARALQITSDKAIPFEDVTAHQSSIAALFENGIVSGKTATSFDPKASATRGEAAVLLAKAYEFEQNRPFALDVFHVNDLHANVEKYPKLVSAVKEQRIHKRDALLLNAGDVFSGSLYFNLHEGKADNAVLNLLNFDAMVFGNHEFDLGSSPAGHESLKTFIETSNYPFVAANLDFSKDALFTGLQTKGISAEAKDGHIYDAIIKEVKGEKVGIFGLTTEETVAIASPGSVAFAEYIETAKAQVAALEAQGVNKIIALTHIGYDDNALVDNDQILAKAVPGIDIIVGGHTHTKLDAPVVIDKDLNGGAKDATIIVHAYQYADYLGTVNVEFDDAGKITNFNGKLVTLSGYANDAQAVSVLAPYKAAVEEFSKKEIGVTLEVNLLAPRTSDPGNDGKSIRNSEQPLGNLITDGMLIQAKKNAADKNVIMAVTNGGGIRASIPAGQITVGQVKTVLPFGNTLAIVDLTGKEIKSVFEHSFKEYPKESGGFLHVSGGKITIDSSKPVGERIVKIEYIQEDGTLVEVTENETYTIASNFFTILGGDGYSMLLDAYKDNRVTDFGSLDSDNFEAHLKSLGTITADMVKLRNTFIDVATN